MLLRSRISTIHSQLRHPTAIMCSALSGHSHTIISKTAGLVSRISAFQLLFTALWLVPSVPDRNSWSTETELLSAVSPVCLSKFKCLETLGSFLFSSLLSFENTPTSPAVTAAPQTTTQVGCSLINSGIPGFKDPRRTFITTWVYVHEERHAHEHILSPQKLCLHDTFICCKVWVCLWQCTSFWKQVKVFLFLYLKPLQSKNISHSHSTL